MQGTILVHSFPQNATRLISKLEFNCLMTLHTTVVIYCFTFLLLNCWHKCFHLQKYLLLGTSYNCYSLPLNRTPLFI